MQAALWAIALLILFSAAACSRNEKTAEAEEEEALSRTEFTDRIENFFEHDPMRAGKPGNFLIHLTDLADGSPVEKADVTLTIRSQASGAEVGQTKAKIGKVTGIYVAEVTIPQAGDYSIEFRVKNEKLDERMPLTDFKVE